ncbi:Uncharacterized protein conserved in bacteria, NMA0228-like [hydrothermal vent metagenome]|uniref:Uncharacterized protein conserved in bacteria, NMA0228-like n=1 Tax=hydrothermal vent metagenome TaxID=652676 RepID=A0A3B0W486_9ZZZZ
MAILSQTASPISGVGIGLRSQHIQEILTALPNTLPNIGWLELLADNHLAEGGLDVVQLDAIAEHYPLTLHCVGMSLASVEPLDLDYCQKIKKLSKRVNARCISEHLCFSAALGLYSHDLLPIPYNQKTLAHCVQRVLQVQEVLGERILVENVSSYMTFQDSDMDEVDFICALAEQADCDLLVDVNNIYVNQLNHGLDGEAYIDQLPLDRIKEIHLAGYQQQDNFVLDAHNNPVSEPVWQLYRRLIAKRPSIPTLIEWDNDIPPLTVLLKEAEKAHSIMQGAE